MSRRALTTLPARDGRGEAVNAWSAIEGRWLGQGDYLDGPVSGPVGRRCQGTLATGSRCPFWAVAPYAMCLTHMATDDKVAALSLSRYDIDFGGSATATKFKEAYARFLTDPDIADLTAELAIQKAFLQHTIDQVAGNGGLTADAVAALTQLNHEVAELAERHAKVAERSAHRLTATRTAAFIGMVIDAVDAAVLHTAHRLLGGYPENDELVKALHVGILNAVADSLEGTTGGGRGGRSAFAGPGRDNGLDAHLGDGGPGAEGRELGQGGDAP